MTNIIISNAPEKYQRHLTIGDAKGNYNQKVDDFEEAKTSAKELCSQSSSKNCQEFLKYLEGSGYVLKSSLPDLFGFSPQEKATWEKIEGHIKDLGSKKQNKKEAAAEVLQSYASSDISPLLKAKMIGPLSEVLEKSQYWRSHGGVVAIMSQLATSNISPDAKLTMVDPLFMFLGHKDSYVKEKGLFGLVRDSAAYALENIVTSNIPKSWKTEIAERLIKLLKDDDWHKRAGAAYALGQIAFHAEGKEKPDPDISIKLKEKMVEPLLAALKDRVPAVCVDTAQALRILAFQKINLKLKEKMVDPLITSLKDKNWGVRWFAAAALNNLAGEAIPVELKAGMVMPLLGVLGNKEMFVRESAARAIQTILASHLLPNTKIKIVERLLEMLKKKSWSSRTGAARALGHIASLNEENGITLGTKKRMIYPLIKAAKDKSWHVKAEALRALGELAEADIPESLKEKMLVPIRKGTKDKNYFVSYAAYVAFLSLSINSSSQKINNAWMQYVEETDEANSK